MAAALAEGMAEGAAEAFAAQQHGRNTQHHTHIKNEESTKKEKNTAAAPPVGPEKLTPIGNIRTIPQPRICITLDSWY